MISKKRMNTNKNNKLNRNIKNTNIITLELNSLNLINGGENFDCKSGLEGPALVKTDLDKENEKIEENNRNLLNKKLKLLNEEMLEKIKSTLYDNLKDMFNFSYENFLSKKSEPESKEYSINKVNENSKEEYFEERNYSG